MSAHIAPSPSRVPRCLSPSFPTFCGNVSRRKQKMGSGRGGERVKQTKEDRGRSVGRDVQRIGAGASEAGCRGAEQRRETSRRGDPTGQQAVGHPRGLCQRRRRGSKPACLTCSSTIESMMPSRRASTKENVADADRSLDLSLSLCVSGLSDPKSCGAGSEVFASTSSQVQ